MARTIFSWRVPPVVLSTRRHLPHVERTGEATSSMPCRRNDHRATDRLATASRSPGRRSDPESWRKRRPSPSFPSLLNPHSLMSGKWLGGKLTDIKDILKAQVALSRSFQRFTIQSRSGRKTSPGCEAASVRNPDNDVSENQPSRDEPAREGFLHRLRDWPQCRRDRRRAPPRARPVGPTDPTIEIRRGADITCTSMWLDGCIARRIVLGGTRGARIIRRRDVRPRPACRGSPARA